MDTDAPLVSMIIPTYNEEKRIIKTLQEIIQHIDEFPGPVEIIVVDDGSTDKTRELIYEFSSAIPCLKLIENCHSGKAYTLRTGFLSARGKYSVQVDADLSTPLSDINQLIDTVSNGYDIALGVREGRHGAPSYRVLMSLIWRILVLSLLRGRFKDTQCGFKAYKTEAIQSILKSTILYTTPETSLTSARVTAASDIEILFLALKMKYQIASVPVEWRHANNSKLNAISDSLQAFIDLLKIHWYSFSGAYNLPDKE